MSNTDQTENHPTIGYEFDWFAIDSNDNIGLFSCGGFGMGSDVPESVVRNWKRHSDIADEIPKTLRHSEFFMNYAISGLFVYDWKFHEGPYLKINHPLFPVDPQLREKIAAIPELLVLPVDFEKVSSIDVSPFN